MVISGETGVIVIALYVVWIGVSYWVSHDAKRRDSPNHLTWGIGVFVVGPLVLILYLIYRPRDGHVSDHKRKSICNRCKEPVHTDARVCPHCNATFARIKLRRGLKFGLIVLCLFLTVATVGTILTGLGLIDLNT